ncbi:MAG: serine/threonine-protein kinase, partial [Myxococcales bacterium]|nr:serine/threonine-protein kinase [Myxococcales bacterium]
MRTTQIESTPTWLVGPEIPPAARIGTVLIGTYRLDAFLGQGATGINYNAWHLRQNAPYAIKLLRRELAHTHERMLRLRNDLRTLSRVPGVLKAELGFTPEGAPFLASDLLVGQSLRQRLLSGPLPVAEAGMVVATVARTLAQVHAAGTVHGDVRPEHIFLPAQASRGVVPGRPVLLDAGLHHLRKRGPGLDEDIPLERLRYLAPEQVAGEVDSPSPSADLFALGAILYETLTGRSAFGADQMEVVLEKLAQPPPRLALAGVPTGLAAALDEVIARACARRPEDRFADGEALAAAVEAAFARAGVALAAALETVPAMAEDLSRAVRRRTVVHKKVVPLRRPEPEPPPGPLPSEEGGPSCAAQAAPPPSTAAAPASEVTPPCTSDPVPPQPSSRNRRPKATVRVRDLARLVSSVEQGQSLEEALADDQEQEGEQEQPPRPMSERERMLEQGRAAVLARAEAARAQRDKEQRERAERQEAARREATRRMVEAARAEVLARMRAELAEADKLRAAEREARKEAARREAERLEAARREAERLEAERAEAARREAERAEAARREAERAEAARREAERIAEQEREAERLEAERAEAARREAERLEAERLEAERWEAERAEAARREAERAEAARREAERLEAERLEAERVAAEAERLAAEAAS